MSRHFSRYIFYFEKYDTCTFIQELFQPVRLLFLESLSSSTVIQAYRQQPSPLLYSIDIWPAHNSRLTQRETNHYIARCASVLAWSYLAGRLPEELVIDLFAQHQRCCPWATYVNDRVKKQSLKNCSKYLKMVVINDSFSLFSEIKGKCFV